MRSLNLSVGKRKRAGKEPAPGDEPAAAGPPDPAQAHPAAAFAAAAATSAAAAATAAAAAAATARPRGGARPAKRGRPARGERGGSRPGSRGAGAGGGADAEGPLAGMETDFEAAERAAAAPARPRAGAARRHSARRAGAGLPGALSSFLLRQGAWSAHGCGLRSEHAGEPCMRLVGPLLLPAAPWAQAASISAAPVSARTEEQGRSPAMQDRSIGCPAHAWQPESLTGTARAAGGARRAQRLAAALRSAEHANETDGEASLTDGGCRGLASLGFVDAAALPLLLTPPGLRGAPAALRASELGFLACSDAPATPGGGAAAAGEGLLGDGAGQGLGGGGTPARLADAVAGDAELDNAISWLGVPSPAAKPQDAVRGRSSNPNPPSRAAAGRSSSPTRHHCRASSLQRASLTARSCPCLASAFQQHSALEDLTRRLHRLWATNLRTTVISFGLRPEPRA